MSLDPFFLKGGPMIKAIDLSHHYRTAGKDVPALQHIDLQIEQGSHVAILGPNGCGKSTLAKHFNALLLPTQGQVFIDGMDTQDSTKTWEIRQKVGMVFQNPDNQLVATTVLEEVAFGPENLGLPRAEILARVEEALASVSMTDFKEAQPHQLSGGQKQRIAIAGVIAMQPDVLVFDEPTAMLDPQGRADVMATLLDLNQSMGLTTLNITHFMEEAVLADRVLVMDQGRIVCDGPPRQVFQHFDTLRSLHLDIPVMMELAAALHEAHPSFPKDILTINEMVGALWPSK